MTPSMTCEQFEVILPQLLDEESAAASMTPLARAHLDGCADCRSVFDDLNALRASARALPGLTPTRDLWSGIASRIEASVVPLVEGRPVRRPRRQLSWRSAGVAAAALVAVNLAVTYQVVQRSQLAIAPVATVADASHPVGTTPDTSGSPFTELTGTKSSPGLASATPEIIMPTRARASIVLATNQSIQPQQREAARVVYNREITRLRAIVDSGRQKLDPATVAILERNLRVIDSAIEQCNDALLRDSGSAFLIESLNNAYQTKVKLLRIAAAAASRG